MPQLPTEFYDGIILAKIGNAIDKLLKIDVCTSATIRGRYARLCVQLPPEQKVQSHILIGTHKQVILYEGDNSLCKVCGCLGHCSHPITHNLQAANGEGQDSSSIKTSNGERQPVFFPKKKKPITNRSEQVGATSSQSTSINVKKIYAQVSSF